MNCPAHLRPWTDDEMAALADMIVGGLAASAIAVRLGRSESAIENRRRRILCPVDGNKPGWQKRPYGSGPGKTFWSQERVVEGLQDFAARNRGQLPTSDHVYNELKKGHGDWPTAQKVLEYFGSMANAWAAAGISKKRFNRGWNEWTPEEEEYLLEHAGNKTLRLIGAHLGRSWAACKRRLYELGAGRARDVSGYLSAMQVAKEYNAPLSRVKKLIATGELPARKVQGGHYWRIDFEDITPEIQALLTKTKGTHKSTPPDLGDYERRYGLRRLRVNGLQVRVEVGA